jgi:membrane protease YdiL (CAAX protease family)
VNLIRRYPVTSYFFLTFVLGGGTIYLAFQGVIPAELGLSSVLSASISGVIMTALLDGVDGLKLMLRRVLIWRTGIGYWFFSLLFIPLALIMGSSLNPLFNGEPISTGEIRPPTNILPFFLVFTLVAGLGQELGWTGFLMPQLQTRFSAFTSCLVRTLLVAIWHLPLLIFSWFQPHALPDFPYGAWMMQKGFPLAYLSLVFMLILPWSTFFTWVFNNTRGSLLLVSVLHGSEIWVAFGMLSLGIDPKNLDNYWGYGLVMLLTALIIVLISGPRNLSRKNLRVS